MAAPDVHWIKHRVHRSRGVVLFAAGCAAVFLFAVATKRGAMFGRTVGSGPPPPLFYVRVPKTGSTSLVGLLGELSRRNAFRFASVHASAESQHYGANVRRLDPANRRAVARGLADGAALAAHTAFYHFAQYQARGQPPAVISVVREPLARFASAYYYERCRTTELDIVKAADWALGGNKSATLDECVQGGGRQCGPASMWRQIPFFCGHAPQCWKVGNEWALAEAKHNLANHFLLVGLTEQMDEFVQLMQIILPQYFAHADEYLQDNNVMRANPGGDCKKEMSPSTKAVLTKWPAYRMEHEFYKFASEIFADTYKRTVAMSSANSDNFFQLDFRTIT